MTTNGTTNTDPQSDSYNVPLNIGNYHLRILPAVHADAEECADVFWDAFENDAIFKAMNGTADLEKVHEHTKEAWAENWNALGNKWFKIVDEDKG